VCHHQQASPGAAVTLNYQLVLLADHLGGITPRVASVPDLTLGLMLWEQGLVLVTDAAGEAGGLLRLPTAADKPYQLRPLLFLLLSITAIIYDAMWAAIWLCGGEMLIRLLIRSPNSRDAETAHQSSRWTTSHQEYASWQETSGSALQTSQCCRL
jgi:hypothetical protein